MVGFCLGVVVFSIRISTLINLLSSFSYIFLLFNSIAQEKTNFNI